MELYAAIAAKRFWQEHEPHRSSRMHTNKRTPWGNHDINNFSLPFSSLRGKMRLLGVFAEKVKVRKLSIPRLLIHTSIIYGHHVFPYEKSVWRCPRPPHSVPIATQVWSNELHVDIHRIAMEKPKYSLLSSTQYVLHLFLISRR